MSQIFHILRRTRKFQVFLLDSFRFPPKHDIDKKHRSKRNEYNSSANVPCYQRLAAAQDAAAKAKAEFACSSYLVKKEREGERKS